jgi:hypothetical protein
MKSKKSKTQQIKERKVMKKLSVLFIAVALLGMAGMSMAQANDNHTVTVVVAGISAINVDNDLTLTINAATAGSEPDAVSNSTTCNLLWTQNGPTSRKIQVKAGAALPTGVTLSVLAQGIVKVGSGSPTAAGTVALSATDQDFLTTVTKSAGTCDLNYTADGDMDAAVQSNAITVTYTIINT